MGYRTSEFPVTPSGRVSHPEARTSSTISSRASFDGRGGGDPVSSQRAAWTVVLERRSAEEAIAAWPTERCIPVPRRLSAAGPHANAAGRRQGAVLGCRDRQAAAGTATREGDALRMRLPFAPHEARHNRPRSRGRRPARRVHSNQADAAPHGAGRRLANRTGRQVVSRAAKEYGATRPCRLLGHGPLPQAVPVHPRKQARRAGSAARTRRSPLSAQVWLNGDERLRPQVRPLLGLRGDPLLAPRLTTIGHGDHPAAGHVWQFPPISAIITWHCGTAPTPYAKGGWQDRQRPSPTSLPAPLAAQTPTHRARSSVGRATDF